MLKNFFQSKLATLSAASVLAAIPVLAQGALAQAQYVADGRLGEYDPYTAPTLTMGVVDPAVEDLQVFLDETGYYYGPIDGEYDTDVMEAVEEYQTDYGLYGDGIVGDNTWASLTGIDYDSVFEDDDYYDSTTGLYTDYEEGIDYSYGDEGVVEDDEGAFTDEDVF